MPSIQEGAFESTPGRFEHGIEARPDVAAENENHLQLVLQATAQVDTFPLMTAGEIRAIGTKFNATSHLVTNALLHCMGETGAFTRYKSYLDIKEQLGREQGFRSTKKTQLAATQAQVDIYEGMPEIRLYGELLTQVGTYETTYRQDYFDDGRLVNVAAAQLFDADLEHPVLNCLEEVRRIAPTAMRGDAMDAERIARIMLLSQQAGSGQPTE